MAGICIGHPACQLIDIGAEISVGQHCPLGATGCTTGILQHGQIVDRYVRNEVYGFAISQPRKRNMAQIFGDFGKFAALEQAEKNAFDRGRMSLISQTTIRFRQVTSRQSATLE